ncbi:hypothetical protein ANO11243_033380 [Dothideomycetidae sp. 11243]|nr:hypothetical protein ANO11243_033380 [fungal sp. No.11243]
MLTNQANRTDAEVASQEQRKAIVDRGSLVRLQNQDVWKGSLYIIQLQADDIFLDCHQLWVASLKWTSQVTTTVERWMQEMRRSVASRQDCVDVHMYMDDSTSKVNARAAQLPKRIDRPGAGFPFVRTLFWHFLRAQTQDMESVMTRLSSVSQRCHSGSAQSYTSSRKVNSERRSVGLSQGCTFN